ncbi:MAG: 50S ribosomal protein L9 [Chthoniobacteraceae bacterium]|nr:50S ribosomal protein L9 [Chthoniobacteraceae bacterium]
MPTTEVILTEKIASLGAEADVVKVKRGYARNFLVPSGKALEVTPVTLRRINQLKAKRAEREAAELNESQELARRINKLKLTITLETGETGKAFGSVTARDLAEKLKAELGVEVDRHAIELERPLKESGSHEVTIKLHHDVVAKLNVTLKPAAEEAPAGEAAAPAEEEGGFKAKPKAKHTK